MPCGLRFDERDQVLFKKKYICYHVLALGIIKVKLLPFKAFKRVGNHGKRALHARILLQIKCTGTFKLTFVPMNGARFSSKWRAHASTKKGNGENGRSTVFIRLTALGTY